MSNWAKAIRFNPRLPCAYIFFISFLLLTGCVPRIYRTVTSADDTDQYFERDSLNKYSAMCNSRSHYIPDSLPNPQTPVKDIDINFHIIRNGEGKGNFSEEAGREFVMQLYWAANGLLEKNQPMLLPPENNTPALPVGFRWHLQGDPDVPGDDGIYFHNEDSIWTVNSSDPSKRALYTSYHYQKYGVQKGDVINIFLMEHHPDSLKSKSYKAKNNGVGTGNWMKMINSYHFRTDSVTNSAGKKEAGAAWLMSGLLNHELGHCLGLVHTWASNDGCDDTPLNPNCWNFATRGPCKDQMSNNVMDYNAYQNAWTPCQLGIVHYNLMDPHRQPRNWLDDSHCQLDTTFNVIIPPGAIQQWDCRKDLRGNLVIKKGASLTIYCDVSIPQGGRITVEPGARLIVNGAKLYNDCGWNWQGIDIMQAGKKNRGQLILQYHATIDNVPNPAN